DPELVDKYTIKSPIQFMLTNLVKQDGPTYFEYLYNVNSRGLGMTSAAREALEKSIITEGSLVLLRMYKLETKSKVRAFFQGAVPVVFAVVGGAVALALLPTGIGVGIGAGIIAAGTIVGGVGGGALSSAVIGYPGEEVFRDCKECNAIGGIMLVPTKQSLNAEIPTRILTESGEQVIDTKICDNRVN
ncbi:MAG: hypothetical protein AABW87_01550, partial [Nanoarchaeota archaeon]